MNSPKDKILIIGGYGAVGKTVSHKLAMAFPEKVIIAGRNLAKGEELISKLGIKASVVELDLHTGNFEAINTDEIHSAIACIEYLKDDNFILWCIKNNINYTELATSYKAYQRLEQFKEKFEKAKIGLIPGVGLMPGLSGIFVQDALLKYTQLKEVQSFILLGLGEHHGLDAIRWMMEFASKKIEVHTKIGYKEVRSFSEPVKKRLLTESRPRRFYRFDFGDQHIIAKFQRVPSVYTRLAFDSAFVTQIIALIGRSKFLDVVTKVNPKLIQKILNSLNIGSNRFVVQTHCYTIDNTEVIYLAEGNQEARATGIIAAYAVNQLYMNMVIGLNRLEELISYPDFVTYLNKNEIKIKTERHESNNYSIT